MKPIKMLVLGASVLAFGMSVVSVGNQAYAGLSGTSEYVKDVDLDFSGAMPVINITNTSANKHVNSVNPTVQNNSINIEIDGFVECKSANNVDFLGAWAYFGGVGIGGFGQLATQGTLHDEKIDVAYKTKDDIAEATEDMFTIPLNKIKNGHPALRVDPLEELEKARQAFNGSDTDFYKQDREIILQRPISLGTVCGKLKNTDKRSVGFETKHTGIKIKYKGDPAVNDKPVLNAQLANNMPNQINNDLPIRLDKAEFQPNIPHYTGKCVPDENRQIQIDLQFSGNGGGYMDLRVQSVSNTYADYGPYYNFQAIPVNAQASKKINFSFPIKTMLEQEKYSYMAISNSKTYNHNMKIEARYKPKEGGNWSQWKDYDTAVFKHRCTPQLNGQLVGGNIGGIGGYDNGAETPKLKIKRSGVNTDPAPINTIKSMPVNPKPARAKRN
jgi:hypothetical protein